MAKEKTLDAAANKRMMFSYLGMLGAAAYFVEPKETYVSVQNAMYVSFGVYGVFYILFTFLNEMFFADNFKKGPKDNFGYIFMKMFGVQGFFQIFILYNFVPAATAFKYMAVMNAIMCYVGPQRGELLSIGNVKDAHIVPHVCLMLVSAAFLATLL